MTPASTLPSTFASPRAAVADPRRLAAVASLGLTGHAHDPELDDVVAHMAAVVRAPIAVVNLVGPDHQCYPAEHGVGAPGTDVADELSFCAYVVAAGAPLQVRDAREHPVFHDNPLVRSGVVAAYLGVPLVDEDGFVLGALSVFDVEPREFTPAERAMLQTQVRLVRTLLSLRRRVAAHAWDARLLAAQTAVLEDVATGRPLASTLCRLDAAVDDLCATADEGRAQRLCDTRARLTQIATDAAGWRCATERMARQDSLTGLANRAYFIEAGRAAVAGGGALLFLDLDRFKEVNDRGSHALGDQLLVRIAERLTARVEAAVPGAVVGRVGGDEFAAALPGVDEARATALGEHLAEVLVEHVGQLPGTVRVSASIGLAMAEPGCTFEQTLHAADEAMYAAKSRGRGCLRVA